MSAKLELTEDEFYDRFDAALAALNAGDDAKADEIAHTIPLPPEVAMQRRRYMSKEDILELGFDMSHVIAEYGEDWYEKP